MVYAKRSWKAAMIQAGLDQPEAQFGCPIANMYYPEEIEALLLKTGWCLETLKQDHIFRWRLDEYLNYEYVPQSWFVEMPDSVFQALKATLGWHLLITALPSL